MTASLTIALILIADLALIAGLAYVMSRARALTPHVSAADAAPTRAARAEPVAHPRRAPAARASRPLAATR